MKPIQVLFLVGMTGLLVGDFQPVDAKSAPTTADVSNTRSYKKISALISTIESDVKRDMATLSKKMSTDEKTASVYKSRVSSYTKSMDSFKRHFNDAQAAYLKFDREFRNKGNENAALLRSLNKQRAFIREERRYINHMEAESLDLKKYSPQYAVIRTEIRQMRVQVNKEIQDVEDAYFRAKKKILAQRNVAKTKRTSAESKKTSYQSMVTRYETLSNTYSELLSKLSVQKSGNLQLRKELQDQIDLLQEIRVILATFKPGTNTDNKYQARYEHCVEDFRMFRNKYHNMNCTALDLTS